MEGKASSFLFKMGSYRRVLVHKNHGNNPHQDNAHQNEADVLKRARV